jgi:hypothetical protein
MAAPARKANRSIYGVHPGIAMVQKWIAELKSKTGRSLDEWISLVKEESPATEADRRVWLKEKHKLGTNSAWWIAERADGKGSEEDTPKSYLAIAPKCVDEQYSGKKESLRPIYERLLILAASLGADVKSCPGKTIVPLLRVNLGLTLTNYKGKLPKRVVDTSGLANKDRITHRIELKTPSEIDDEAKKWLKIAYELDKKCLVVFADENRSPENGGPQSPFVADRRLRDVEGTNNLIRNAIDLFFFVPRQIRIEFHVQSGREHFRCELFRVFAGDFFAFAEGMMLGEVAVHRFITGQRQADAGCDQTVRFFGGIFADHGKRDLSGFDVLQSFAARN